MSKTPKVTTKSNPRRFHRRRQGFNWYSVEHLLAQIRDVDTVSKLRAMMRAMVEDDVLWDLIEDGAELDAKRRGFNDAAAKRIARIRP